MSHRGQLSCLNQPVAYHSHTLTPSSHSPGRMSGEPQRTASQDSNSEGIRKRVCKACDRCRLKKSKCDGASPCSRCKSDNALCVFGERKKSHDKVYPKGYVELLEQQQAKLVLGLQELYRRAISDEPAWQGEPLALSPDYGNNPHTHDILSALGLLTTKADGAVETFEENTDDMQAQLLARGVGYSQHNHQRRASYAMESNSPSDSEHSHQGHTHSDSQGTPMTSRSTLFQEPSYNNIKSETSTPPNAESPAGSQDNQLWVSNDWPSHEQQDFSIMGSDFSMSGNAPNQTLSGIQAMNEYWPPPSNGFNDPGMMQYPPQYDNFFGNGPQLQDGTFGTLYQAGDVSMDMESFMS